jgi:hypothetical protein
MQYKIKLILGYRQDQEISISAEEAHKAYFLFLNPTQRGVFSDGHALIGRDIKQILPDYVGTMGWNPGHVLDPDDWNEIHETGLAGKMRHILSAAKQIGQLSLPEDMNVSLKVLLNNKYKNLALEPSNKRAGTLRKLSSVLPRIG